MSKDQETIVIASAARTPVGAFNGTLAGLPAHDLGKIAIKAALERARVEPGDVSEVILGQILSAGAGPEPGAAGLHQRRHPGRCAGLGHEPAVRLGPARGGARPPSRSSSAPSKIVVAGGQESMSQAPHCIASARRHQDGRRQVHRHHDQGRPVGCLQRLPHGQHRRERGPPVADHPRGAGPLRGRLPEQGRSRQEGRQVQGRDRPRRHQDAQGRDGVRRRRVHQGRRDLRGDQPSCGRPSTRRAA